MSGGRFSNNDFSSEYKKIIIDNKEYFIEKYRLHKKFHQVFLKGFTNINDVEFLKGKAVFVEGEDKAVDFDDLIGSVVYHEGKKIGVVKSLLHTKIYKLINLDSGAIIPINDNFIVKITNERIEVKNI